MRIGPYNLIHQLGAGGMCDVWLARTNGGAEVAIKVMRADTPADLFQQEIQAMARLNHPSIVQILRWGYAEAAEAEISNIAEGTPWFAMPVAEHGAFKPNSVKSWSEFLWFATSLLHALSHSHSRSVIHRDIKPENILVEGDLAKPRYVLSDFGISVEHRNRNVDSREVRYAAAGTAAYISPEQLVGRWRDFGPYTDIFSLGVVFYQIIYGRLPFHSPNLVMLGVAQSNGADFSLEPRFSTPAALKSWLARMLAYDPRGRFALAPDTLHALLAMKPPQEEHHAENGPTSALQNTTLLQRVATTQTVTRVTHSRFPATVHLGDGETYFGHWRDSPHHHEPIGLELFGLRRAHLVGRKSERNACWTVLKKCIQTRTVHSIVLSGADGVGATMLGKWIGEHALELGIASYGQVRSDGGSSAIADSLIRILGLFGLNEDRTRQRLAELFSDTQVDLGAVARLVLGGGMSLTEHAKVMFQVLTALSTNRPIVVLMDDAHRDLETLELAHALNGAPMPVLFVLTARNDDSDSMPHETDRLDALIAMEHSHVLQLQPLSAVETSDFIDSILSLDPEAKSHVLELAGGNPLRVLHLLEIWNLDPNFDDLEGDQVGLWQRRFDYFFGPEDRRAVEVAAVLGESVQQNEWRQVCSECGVGVHQELVDRLIAARIWSNEFGVLRFEHGSMRDAVLSATEPEQRRLYHAAAAKMYHAQNSRTAFGKHLVLAGDADQGLQVLHEVAYEFLLRFRVAQAKSLSAWCHGLLKDQQDSKARLFLDLIDANIALREGPEGVFEEAERIRILAERVGFGTIAAEAIRVRSIYEDPFVDPDRPASHLVTALEHAVDLAAPEDDPNVMARLRHRLSVLYVMADDPARAAEILRINSRSSNTFFASRSLAALSQTLVELGELDEALEAARAAANTAPLEAGTSQLMEAHTTLFEIHRIRGSAQAARENLERAEAFLDYDYATDRATMVVNRAAICLLEEDTDRCRAMVVEALEMMDEVEPYFAYHCEVLHAVAAAQDADGEAWDEAILAGAPKLPGAMYGHFWLEAARRWRDVGDSARTLEAIEIGRSTVPAQNQWLLAQFRQG